MKILITEEQLKRIVGVLTEDLTNDYPKMEKERLIRILELDPESDFTYSGEIFEIGDFAKILLNIEKKERIDSEVFPALERYGRAFVENKDNLDYEIEDIKTLKDLRNLLMDVIKLNDLSELDEDDVDYLFRDNELIIATPLTEKGAFLLSKGTAWPTAWGKYSSNDVLRKYENEFDELNEKGPIYIIIRKHMGKEFEKFIVHLPTKMIMDDQDRETTLEDLMDKSYKIEDFFNEIDR